MMQLFEVLFVIGLKYLILYRNKKLDVSVVELHG